MKVTKRLRALEARLIDGLDGSVTLYMEDGSARDINGPGDYLLDLFSFACHGNNPSPATAHLELIRRSTGAREPGGAHLVELIRSILLSPFGDPAVTGANPPQGVSR